MAPHGAATALPSAIPRSIYGKYKKMTEFFLGWLRDARRVGFGATPRRVKSERKTESKYDEDAEVYYDIVAAIAREPTALPPSLLRKWRHALSACESAITLRAHHAALYFPSSLDNAEDSHMRFLGNLRAWFKTLKEAETHEVATAHAQVEDDEAPLDFSNYYTVLELPDDYFPVDIEEEKSASPGASALSPADTDAEWERLLDQEFENDLNVELSFLFAELEELSEAVYDAFLDVKRHKKTLVEATAVAKVAIDCAESVIAKLQLRFPALHTAQDMMTMIQDRIPRNRLHLLLATLAVAWTPTEHRSQTSPSQYVPETIIGDMLWVSRALSSFAAIPITPGASLVMREEVLGETYSEERTPHYCAPNMVATPSFWMQQLALLHKQWTTNRANGVEQDKTSLSGWFLDHVDQFFTTRSASIHFVFIAICWIRSVSALQGEGGLGRSISLSIMHRWDLEDRLRASIAHGEVLRADPPLHKEMEDTLTDFRQLDNENVILRANPLLAGFRLLDSQFKFLHIGAEALVTTSRFRAFGHVYNALRDRQLVEAIPLVEEMMQGYERSVFTPTRAASVHGSFTRTYLVSSNMTDAAADAMLHHRRPPPARLSSCIRDVYHLPDLSRVLRLLKQKDYSVLPVGPMAASWKALLRAVSDLCTKELFDSRVLSRDTLKFSDDLTDMFNLLCDELERRSDANRILEDGIPRMRHQQVVNRALEDVVVMPLLPFLDCLNRDGTIRSDDVAERLLRLESAKEVLITLGGEDAIEEYCRRAANVVSIYFARRGPVILEASYYSFTAVPEWSLLEFGDVSLHSKERCGDTHDMFLSLLEMMERSEGPLRGVDLKQLKSLVAMDPGILAIATDDTSTELCTLLHQASVGPARDRRLVEWLLQMGALHHQSMHCRHPPAPGHLASIGVHRSQLYNMPAIHSAAKAGLVDVVRMFLEADQMRDLNTVTYHTCESLAHIAVKHGHRDVYRLLHMLGAEMHHRDAFGKHVYDHTTDAAWKREILQLAVEQRRQDQTLRSHKSRDPQLRREGEAAATRLRETLERQRASERANIETGRRRFTNGSSARSSTVVAAVIDETAAATSTNATEGASAAGGRGSKGKKKKKKNVSKKASKLHVEDEATATATRRMQELLVGRPDVSGDVPEPDAETESTERFVEANRIEKLSHALEMLKQGTAVTSEERDALAKQALEIVDYLKTTCQYLTTRGANHDLLPADRTQQALEMYRAVFLLNKFHRQLPETARLSYADTRKPLADEDSLSAFEKLVRRAGPPLDFDDFLAFVLDSAQVLVANGGLQQAKEVLELVERRLLKMKQRHPAFRNFVKGLVNARRKAGFEPVEGSTPQARRALEWYVDNHTDVDDDEALRRVDMLHGCEWFFKLKHIEFVGSVEFTRFTNLLTCVGNTQNTELDGVVVLDGYVVAGFESRDKLERVRRRMLEMASDSGLSFDHTHSEHATKKLTLVGFEFSATGIVREDSA